MQPFPIHLRPLKKIEIKHPKGHSVRKLNNSLDKFLEVSIVYQSTKFLTGKSLKSLIQRNYKATEET